VDDVVESCDENNASFGDRFAVACFFEPFPLLAKELHPAMEALPKLMLDRSLACSHHAPPVEIALGESEV